MLRGALFSSSLTLWTRHFEEEEEEEEPRRRSLTYLTFK